MNDKSRLTTDILSEVCPLAEEWELLRELSLLEVRDDVLWRPFFTLSNGEQTKVLLAALFLNDGHFLLIDEPTNHLDMESITALNNGLIKFSGVALFTSHDHQFIQTTANRIMEIVPSGQLIDKIQRMTNILKMTKWQENVRDMRKQQKMTIRNIQ